MDGEEENVADFPAEIRTVKGRFVKGHKAPGPGRPKGSPRTDLGRAFIEDVQAAWQARGREVIDRVIEEKPEQFLKAMVAILPKEIDVQISNYDSMTDAQLRSQFLAALRDARALGIDFGAGDAQGADQAPRSEPPLALLPVH